jgi:hypothetical protein
VLHKELTGILLRGSCLSVLYLLYLDFSLALDAWNPQLCIFRLDVLPQFLERFRYMVVLVKHESLGPKHIEEEEAIRI